MLQITLDSAAKQQKNIQSVNSNNWGFKLQVVNEGDSTELRVCFYDDSTETNVDSNYDVLPNESNEIIGDPLS